MLVLTGMGLIVCLGLAVIDSSTEQADGHVHSRVLLKATPGLGHRDDWAVPSGDVTASRGCPQAQLFGHAKELPPWGSPR